MRAAGLLLPAVLPALAACGPVPLEQAEADCLDRAELAAHPRGEMVMGVASGHGGHGFGGVGLTFSTDYLMHRDPAAVYADCVQAMSGQPPHVPLYDRPDWKG